MKKSKQSVLMMLCLILILALTGCRSKKETNDQSNQKGTAIYYTNNDVTKLVLKRKNIRLEGNQIQKVQTLLKELQKSPKSVQIRSGDPKENCDQQF